MHQQAVLYIYGMELTFNTPALLFPAISLLLLAYTNRFIALANLVRTLHKEYRTGGEGEKVVPQIRNLRRRINMIRYMQGLGVFAFVLCVVAMYCIYNNWMQVAHYVFALSLLSLLSSLVISLIEITASTNALEVQLSDIEDGDLLSDIWNKKS
jgi:hypothetical protein